MALILLDSFNLYGEGADVSAQMENHWLTVTPTGDGMRTNAGYLEMHCAANEVASLVLPILDFDGATELVLGLRYFFTVGGNTNNNLSISLFGLPQVTFLATGSSSTATIAFQRLGSAVNSTFSTDKYEPHHMEIRLVDQDTDFDCYIYVDGANVITELALPKTIVEADRRIILKLDSTVTGVANCLIDDFYVISNTGDEPTGLMGPTAKVECLFPSAAKDATDTWAKVGTGLANNTDAVNDPGYLTDKYITTGTPSLRQEFEFQNLTNIISPVAGQLRSVSYGTSGATLKHSVNGSDVQGFTVTTDYKNTTTMLNSALMTTTNINAIQAGVST